MDKDFSSVFNTQDKVRLIEMYHRYDNNKQDLWKNMLDDIYNQFGVQINPLDIERFRSWFKRVRRNHDRSYTPLSEMRTVFNSEHLALQSERVRLQDQRNALNATIRQQSRFEYLSECFQGAALEVAKHKPLQWSPQVKSGGHKEGVLLLSDWHVGTVVDSDFNQYNVQECRRRLEQLVKKVIQYGKEHKIKTLHVFDLGDLIAGIIHNAVRVASSEDVISQLMLACEYFAEIVAALANVFPAVKVYSVTDNHSRIMQNKNDVLQKESFARCIPWYLSARLAHMSNVSIMNECVIDNEIAVVDIMGRTIFAVHGHRDNVKNIVADLPMMIKKFPEYIFMAHYHHHVEEEFHGCEVIVNPSLVGVEEHSKGIRKTSNPAQKLLIFNESGKECTYIIRVGAEK